MSLEINGSFGKFLSQAEGLVLDAADIGVKEAAYYLHYDVMYAFDVGGPGWKALSDETLKKKMISGSKTVTSELREFDVLKDSIIVRNEATKKMLPLMGRETLVSFNNPSRVSIMSANVDGSEKTSLIIDNPGGSWSWKSSKRVGVYYENEFAYSVGLFAGMTEEYDYRLKDVGFRGPTDVLHRGHIHEFGGFETQTRRAMMEEIRTGHLTKKAASGKELLSGIDREVKKKERKRFLSRLVYIPSRSFIRMPFDRSYNVMIQIIMNSINRAFDVLEAQ
jgi:hypothetical protein